MWVEPSKGRRGGAGEAGGPLPGHGLEETPPPMDLLVLGLQWLVVLAPGLLVLGEVVAGAEGLAPPQKTAFLQRLLLACGLAQAAQVLWGHRLPGLVGPSSVLMVGVMGAWAAGAGAVNGGLLLGGGLTLLLGLLGLARPLGRLFTRPVLAATLALIAATLAPSLVERLAAAPPGGSGLAGLYFGLLLALGMLAAQHRLKGLLSSAVLVLGLGLGSLLYYLLGLAPWPGWAGPGPGLAVPGPLIAPLGFQPGTALALCLCYLAVVANELATVEALGAVTRAPGLGRRVGRALGVCGLGGMLAGLLGVPGVVTYSLSPAMVQLSRSHSRQTLLPVAGALVLMAFWPAGLYLFGLVPPPVVGAVLFHLLASTLHAALNLLVKEGAPGWREGIVLGASLTTGLVLAFLPPAAAAGLPIWLRPLLTNGFVMGLLVALGLEHLALRPAGNP